MHMTQYPRKKQNAVMLAAFSTIFGPAIPAAGQGLH
jgi:hypothetical protein